MKAAWYERNGPANSVLEIGDKPTPKPNAGEVLVRLETSGVNPSDVKSRAGRPPAFDYVIPHSDGAGWIEDTGAGVDSELIRKRVWVWNGQWQRQSGTAAEYICLPVSQTVLLPDSIDFETAACFGIPGLTAAHAINRLSRTLESGRVLVTGAASSVGHYIVQMASQAGFEVIGTASSGKHDIVLSAGALAAIDYKQENVGERVLELTNGDGVDAVIDMDFQSTSLLVSSPAIKPWATILCYGSNDMGEIGVPFRDLLFKSLKFDFFLVYELSEQDRAAAISRLVDFIQSGNADTRIGEIMPLEEIVKAHELVESGQANGNVVLKIV